MSTISVEEIERDPAAFVDRVEAGEAMVVVRGDQPVAEVTPLHRAPPASPRPHGLAAGEFSVPDDFDAPLPPSVIEDFEGR